MRCNVGVNPKYLADQHVIAEYRELPMVIGSLDYWKWEIKSPIPEVFNLGIGHMNFLKNKLLYLKKRHISVKDECKKRNFKCDSLTIDISNYPRKFCNDWSPSIYDSIKIRNRIIEKLLFRYKKSPSFWKYYKKTMNDINIQEMIFNIRFGKLFNV